jgi:hypothetical protein
MTGPIPLSHASLGLNGEIKGEVLLVEDLGSDALLHVQPDDVFAFHPAIGARLAG